ncbi:hypothetical protein ACF1BU_27525 [Streptomyces sp. NPDC014724]|uniref:hypothetical protein n=1 Tax=unclassified Streptomyces TaxID=2593676 RepID=UPI0036FF821F
MRVTTTAKRQGSQFSWQLPDEIPGGTVVSWHVRADNGEAVSPWNSEGAGTVCEFVYDDDDPEQPVVSSADYPDGDAWTDGVGVRGTFHVVSPSEDVASYSVRRAGARVHAGPAAG